MLALLVSVAGCKKDETGLTDTMPRIKTYTLTNALGDSTTYTYTYNDKGNIISELTSLGIGSYYYYNANKIVRIDSYDGDTLFVYTTNSAGYVISAVDQGSNNYTYDYNSNNNIISDNGNTATWMEGNRIVSNTNTIIYSYNSQLNTIGNGNKGQKYFGEDSKNLVEYIRYFGANTTTYYAYSIDNQNRVIRRTNGTLVETYTYY